MKPVFRGSVSNLDATVSRPVALKLRHYRVSSL
jgi:hypothetical protein